jgi:hypothetical protein
MITLGGEFPRSNYTFVLSGVQAPSVQVYWLYVHLIASQDKRTNKAFRQPEHHYMTVLSLLKFRMQLTPQKGGPLGIVIAFSFVGMFPSIPLYDDAEASQASYGLSPSSACILDAHTT